MSTVTVQLFASYAETFGNSRLEVPLQDGGTVADLIRSIRSLPAGSKLPDFPRVAVNRKLAGNDQPVGGSDEVALIPPVAGG